MDQGRRDKSRRRRGIKTSRRSVLKGLAGVAAVASGVFGTAAGAAASLDANPDVLQWSDEIWGANAWSGVPADLLAGMIDVESGGDRWFVSSAGALGLMQIMPWWFDDLGVDLDRWAEPDVNAEVGATILAHVSDGSGDWWSALAAYFGDGCDDYGACTDDYVALVLERAAVYTPYF